MSDFRLHLREPPIQNFNSIHMAAKYSGHSSNTIIAFVNGEISFVTPGAKFDYIERVSWKKLLPEVIEIIKQYGKNAALELHNRHKDAISAYTSAFVN